MTSLTERELTFTFPSTWKAEYFDTPGRPLPKHIAPVDFVVESDDQMFLIEVKDPSTTKAPRSEQQAFVRKMQSDELTHQELVPKARTSWSYLHLMDRTAKPIIYVVAIGAERLSIQPPLWMSLADKLKKRLADEADTPWLKRYVQGCIVVPALDLGNYISGVSVARGKGGP